MTSTHLLISIPDKSIGFAPGDDVTINLHPLGLHDTEVSVRFVINDPLGATVHSSSEEAYTLADDNPTLPYRWQVSLGAVPGSYLITAHLHSDTEILHAIETDSFDVVVPGDRLPDGFPVAIRDRVAAPRNSHDPVSCDDLKKAFDVAHRACDLSRNEDGSWGSREDGTPVEYRTAGNVVLGYLYGLDAAGDDVYRERAVAGLDYLLSQQEPNGAYRWWRPGYPEGILSDRHSFYDTGWAALALAEGYRITKDERYLEGARRSGDWTITCPFTGNNNYDAFSLWFLALLYDFTSEEKYLDTAVWRTEGGIFFAQLPRGGFPGHNFHIGYQSIIANGLASLYDVLPEGHRFEHRLRQRLCMALNFCTFMQSPSGDYHQGWEYDREFRLDEAGNPAGNTSSARSELIRAFYKAKNRLDVPEAVYHALCRSILSRIGSLETAPEDERKGFASLMDVGVLLRWGSES